VDTTLPPWQARSFEDGLLAAYVAQVGGRLFTEVPIGRPSGPASWPVGSGIRRIDAVRVLGLDGGPVRCAACALGEFRDIIRERDVELVEVKRSLTRGVIGQVIVALDMFALDFPGARTVAGIALCHDEDPALRLVCERRGIRVVSIDPVIGGATTSRVPALRRQSG
jgi:hypothetical protein